MLAKSRISDALDLLNRVRLKLEVAADHVDTGAGDKALAAVHEALTTLRTEFRLRSDQLQGMVIAATADAPISLLLFDGVFASMRTYQFWCNEGMPHCYVAGKLCARPSVFFAAVAAHAETGTNRGQHFRRKAGEKTSEEPAGVTRNPPQIPVPVASAGDAPRTIQIPTGRKPRPVAVTIP